MTPQNNPHLDFETSATPPKLLFVKSKTRIDKKHLCLDNSSLFVFDNSGATLETKTPDIITAEYYAHGDAVFSIGEKTTAETLLKHAALVRRTGDGPRQGLRRE